MPNKLNRYSSRITGPKSQGASAGRGMYTANTMASAIEAMGMSLHYSASTPAEEGDA